MRLSCARFWSYYQIQPTVWGLYASHFLCSILYFLPIPSPNPPHSLFLHHSLSISQSFALLKAPLNPLLLHRLLSTSMSLWSSKSCPELHSIGADVGETKPPNGFLCVKSPKDRDFSYVYEATTQALNEIPVKTQTTTVCIDMHTHAGNTLNNPATLTSDPRVTACRDPAVE